MGAGWKLTFPSWDALNVATPKPTIVTLPFASTVAIFGLKLANETGNSVNVIHKHYKVPFTEENATAYFSIGL